MTLEEFEASLTYQHGEVILGDGLATVQVPEGFGLLGPDDGERLPVAAKELLVVVSVGAVALVKRLFGRGRAEAAEV